MPTSFSEDWLLVPESKNTPADTLRWTTLISRSRVSTVDGLGFSENVTSEAMNSLESLLRAVQELKLKRLYTSDLEEPQFVAAGETFSVSQCRYQGSVVAIKRIRIDEHGKESDRRHFQRRLQSVLREILIMCHPPLAHHPNVISLLGYGWTVEEQRTSPFVSVEFASKGSLREYIKEGQSMKTKLILMGDVGAGLMALHKCGIIHGDLKMDNVVVFASLERPSGSVAKVSDFGHSILASSTPKKRTQYFGTALYNAPEVSTQRSQPIPEDQLHKCDIWAFGLCVWEILADGQVYFQHTWQSNPLYKRSSSNENSWTMVKSSSTSDTHDETLEKGGQRVSGRFDPSNLKILAVEFVNGLKIPGVGFEKGMLRPLLSRTLQTDPNKRISDLSRLPIISFWNKAPGGHYLQSKLATYTMSGDIRYSIFSRDNGPYIIWEQQQQLLQDFEAGAERAQPGKKDGSDAFQTMLCYVNAFGTSGNLAKATKFLQKAEEEGNLIARLLGPRILDGFTNTSCLRKTYSESLALCFSITQQPQMPSNVFDFKSSSISEHLSYEVFREVVLSGELEKDVIEVKGLIPNTGSSVRLRALDLSIQHGDCELVDALLHKIESNDDLNSEGKLLVIQAASRGHGSIVTRLLKAGAPITPQKSSSLLHWLFCLDEQSLTDVQSHLLENSYDLPLEALLNEASTEKFTVHSQWPFQVHGTPLAIATAAGNVAAVKVLLSLNANPLAPAFAVVEGDSSPSVTPIHLAVRYHFPMILELLWQTAFSEKQITVTRHHLSRCSALGSFPIACALSLLTNAERFAIHSSTYKEALRITILLLSTDILFQSSPEGKSALTQAIDLEDVDTVELLLQHCPVLASRKLEQPNCQEMFTYPLHFAVQIGSCRDTEESVSILKLILQLDPVAIDRLDSSSVKPIHVAAMGTSTRIMEYLLSLGTSCDDLDCHGQSPLHFCITASNAKLLLSKGANIDQKDKLGFTAAHSAASKGNEDVLQALINAGGNLSSQDNKIGTPLHCAIERKSRTMAEMLLKAGADINAQDKHGRTPLLMAMNIGRSDLVLFLFENGAHPFIEDNAGSSPFLMSLAWESSNILSRFQNHSYFEQISWEAKLKALYFAAESGEPKPLKEYLRKLPKPPTQVYDCEYPGMVSAIHKCAASCRADLLEVLLSAGFKVDSRDAAGNTPLIIASRAGRGKNDTHAYLRTYTCQRLIENGADILAKHNGGLTAFKIARAHRDYPLMTLFLERVLEMNDLDTQARRSRILDSITDPSKEKEFCKEARAMIGNEIFEAKLIQDAVLKEEWDFIMTCIGGCFIFNDQFGSRDFNGNAGWGMTDLDMVRYYSALKDRDMVRWIFLEIGDPRFEGKWDVGGRNLNMEFRETKGSADELLWPGQAKILSNLDRSILMGPIQYIHALDTVPVGRRVSMGLRSMKFQAPLDLEDVSEYELDHMIDMIRMNIQEVDALSKILQDWHNKRNQIRDHGDKMDDLEWARGQIEKIQLNLDAPTQTHSSLMTSCSAKQSKPEWKALYQREQAGSEKLTNLSEAVNTATEQLDRALDMKRGNV
ncbi:hypothetical protein N7448_004065 [Penicillium atrosanguineum]|nr:hypothetical protein N7448_004065 [Penicillium atrosanguineum]